MSARPEPREIVLSAAWHEGAVPATLATVDGVPLEIVHRGIWSHGLGPDFNDALILLPDGSYAPVASKSTSAPVAGPIMDTTSTPPTTP